MFYCGFGQRKTPGKSGLRAMLSYCVEVRGYGQLPRDAFIAPRAKTASESSGFCGPNCVREPYGNHNYASWPVPMKSAPARIIRHSVSLVSR